MPRSPPFLLRSLPSLLPSSPALLLFSPLPYSYVHSPPSSLFPLPPFSPSGGGTRTSARLSGHQPQPQNQRVEAAPARVVRMQEGQGPMGLDNMGGKGGATPWASARGAARPRR